MLVELAAGSQHVEPLFLGEVLFDGVRQWVDISVTQGADALLGTVLLQDYQLEIHFRSRTVCVAEGGSGVIWLGEAPHAAHRSS